MDSGVRQGGTGWGFDTCGKGSLIDRMTAEAQARRDQFDHGTVRVDGKVYRMKEDWVAVMDRAAAKYGTPAPTPLARAFRGASR
jgi:hypothetical protein